MPKPALLRPATIIVVLLFGYIFQTSISNAAEVPANSTTLRSPAAQVAAQPVMAGLQGFHFVSAAAGWLLINQHLYWTSDTGRTWTAITPPDLDAAMISAVSFVNAQNGWLILITPDPTGISDFSIAQTSNGGTSWIVRPLALFKPGDVASLASAVYLDFFDAHTGWLVIKRMTSRNFSVGTLFKTTDGGATWTQLTLPIGEPVSFITAQIGFTAGGVAGDSLYRTQDGGQSWQAQTVGLTLPTNQHRSYQLPVFADANSGVLAVSVINDADSSASTQIEFYTTADGGKTWTLARSVSADSVLASGVSVPVAVLDRQHWALVLGHKNQFIGLMSGSAPASVIGQTPLLTGISTLDFPTASVGVGLSMAGSCTEIPSGNGTGPATKQCILQSKLIGTADGGKSWKALQLPEADANTGSQTTTTQIFTPHIAASPANAPANITAQAAGTSAAQGFDSCGVPGLNQMQDWSTNSPYSVVNLYLGGSVRGCQNLALSATFLTQLSQEGWSFIPTWVGPQAECAGFGTRMSSDPNMAYSQGVSEANSATDVASSLGLSSSDSVIYYDLEAYNTSDSTCRSAAQAFISGWSGQLRARGVKAGVYGSSCSSAPTDWTSSANVPDSVWLAQWIYASYNSSATVWSIACIGDTYWPNHQRIRQYAGGHSEFYGNTALNIDSDVVDGAVTTLGQSASNGAPIPNPYTGTAVAIPGTVQAENFDKGGQGVGYYDLTAANFGGANYRPGEAVDITYTSDSGGGYAVNYAEPGEWLDYAINIGQAGTYTITVRFSSGGPGGMFHLEFGGVDKTGPISVPNSGSWTTYQNLIIPGIALSAGTQVMRVVMDSRGPSNYIANFNYFTLASSALPGQIMQAAPAGEITARQPALNWQPEASSTQYDVEVYSGATQVFAQVVDAKSACTAASCSVTVPNALNAGSYLWMVAGKNDAGTGPYSTANFVVSVTPGPVQRISPVGAVTLRRPILTWQRDPNVAQYGIMLTGPSGLILSRWYDANTVCSGTTCLLPVFTADQSAGAYNWSMSSISNTGDSGPWDTTTFEIAYAPAGITQLLPRGNILTRRPALTWRRLADATWYDVTVYKGGALVLSQRYDANTVCNSLVCTLTLTSDLSAGDFSWQVAGGNAYATGPLNSVNFSVALAPRSVTATSPSGTINTATPVLVWQRNTDATWYIISLTSGYTVILNNWYSDAKACVGNVCSIVIPNALAQGKYVWQVRAWNPFGSSAWSPALSFVVTNNSPTAVLMAQ